MMIRFTTESTVNNRITQAAEIRVWQWMSDGPWTFNVIYMRATGLGVVVSTYRPSDLGFDDAHADMVAQRWADVREDVRLTILVWGRVRVTEPMHEYNWHFDHISPHTKELIPHMRRPTLPSIPRDMLSITGEDGADA